MAKKWGRGGRSKTPTPPTKEELLRQREFLILMGADGSDEVDNYYIQTPFKRHFSLYGPYIRIRKKDYQKAIPFTPKGYPVIDTTKGLLKSVLGKSGPVIRKPLPPPEDDGEPA